MSTPTITAAYVWQCASDLRANRDIADHVHVDVTDTDISVCAYEGDLMSVLAAAAMLDDPEYRSHHYKDDLHIVSARGTYRGVPVTTQGTYTNPDMVLAALAGQVS
jgi:hypothetical protein